jgi:D-alanyl-D-alanine dipeptidase
VNTRRIAALLIAIGGCWFGTACSHRDGLVDVGKLNPRIELDIRYATVNNFTRQKVYDEARCELREEVAKRLLEAEHEFEQSGLGLKVYDCYRPLSVQKRFWALVPDERYVANPEKGSRHNRGASVDATLVRLSDGAELPMGTDFDDFSERAHRDYKRLPAEALKNRQMFERVMGEHGFVGLPTEWWHYDAVGWERYPIEDVRR